MVDYPHLVPHTEMFKMLEHDELVRGVLAVAAPHDINLIVLFGSRARGDHHSHSDLDIAVSTSVQDDTERFKLRLNIISQFEGPRLKVDVVIIEDVGWSLRYRIARDGNVLYQKESDSWANFIEDVLIYYPDYRIFEQRFLRATLGGDCDDLR